MKIGVLGGSFDPVHTGHLLLAENARMQAGLSRVLFMPAYIQPFKRDARVSPDDERTAMLRFALRGNPYFAQTDVELVRGGVSYTIDSLRELRAGAAGELAGDRLAFILGTDMFLMMEKWHLAAELLAEFDIIVGVRPGYAGGAHEKVERYAAALRERYGANIRLIGSSDMELSSSDIRERLTNGGSLRYLVPEDARRYLLVRAKEDAARWEHTKGVMRFAGELADRYGENRHKAELAALLHDYCKDSSGGAENNLRHGALAAEAAKAEFGIDDADILNAIRYHTTGRAHMSRLETIVFIADTLAPGRNYAEVDELRKLAETDLNRCALAVLTELEKYVKKSGYKSSRDSREAIAWLRGEGG
ncbi:MAG: nicotinate (nicotinamide) nucleotide adenylyltransferase [Clostridiales Family XIII bacterium]|jgi:nicotinate-nucleotide adenylyltransferase|nr:nicotinate (nicotinamide) nucleotide adenylyltransferase [Clostridiales Family XIII bacterium]